MSIEELVASATENFTKIVSVSEIKEKYPKLYWGGNGVGDRWACKKFNYTSISKKSINTYSENENDSVPINVLNEFLQNHNGSGILGIYVHSKKSTISKRPIGKAISNKITKSVCVQCGTTKTICDHKNDLYNDMRVLSLETQELSDFQALCNHCNLQKRQVCVVERDTNRLYSAKNIPIYKIYPFEFPWEKKAFDINDINCKKDTYWYDPVEFNELIKRYMEYTLPIITELKRKFRSK